MLGNLKLIVTAAVIVAFVALGAAYSLEKAKRKAAEAELTVAQTTIATQNATIASQHNNVVAIQGSAAAQQAIQQQSAPIHQAIEDSTPETLLNEKQKTIADCIVALFRGMLKGGSCGGQVGAVLPEARKAVPDDPKDR
jgi:outer membrane receptor protein involved in Fe transport